MKKVCRLTESTDAFVSTYFAFKKNQYKLLEDKVSADSVRKALAKHTAGELLADLKSEEIPASNDGPVKVLVGKNFEDIVGQPGKVCLLLFKILRCCLKRADNVIE